ncbi:MAG: hypothetical protein JSU92_01560 [Deltaproteobacteria bacterium]|nr:MAG: hypothetical protein JSU92_01560 [Deltaproteobacteria bacterium]
MGRTERDYLITFGTEFFNLLCGIVVYKLAADFLGKEGFSEYALSRRTVSLIQTAILMGLGVGIPRYIAYAHTTQNSKNQDIYFLGGLYIILFILLVFTLLLNLLTDRFSFLIFGSSDYAYLIFPVSLMLVGLVLHSSCYSYYRGKLLMFEANLLQMINSGLVPLFSFFISKNITGILLLTGVLWIVISAIFLTSITRGLTRDYSNIVPCSKELLSYGLQRVPGDFGLAALLTLPAIFTTHIAGVKEAGYVAFGMSLLNLVGSAFAPIGLILLPKASQLIASRDFNQLKYYISKLLKITLSLTLVGVIFFEILADKIIDLYLGQGFSDLILIARIIMIASIAYTVYISMRSIIDAYYVRAMNTKNILLSLLLFILFSSAAVLFPVGYVYITICFTIAIFTLGSLTMFEIRKFQNFRAE